MAEAGPDQALTCTTTSVTLQGSASGNDGRSGFSYAWDPAGSVSDPTAAQPTTSASGRYTLTITDLYTGCTSVDDVLVTEDFAVPVASAGGDKQISCAVGSVVLDRQTIDETYYPAIAKGAQAPPVEPAETI